MEVARPPNAQGVETPVIECTVNNKHTLQARGCLALARARSSSPLHRSPNNFVPAAPSYPSPANTQSLHQTPAGRPLPPHPTRSRVCKQCCCSSHHRVAEHKVNRGSEPALACDLEDLKPTYVEQGVGKGAAEFESLNQIIWSCELNLNKQ